MKKWRIEKWKIEDIFDVKHCQTNTNDNHLYFISDSYPLEFRIYNLAETNYKKDSCPICGEKVPDYIIFQAKLLLKSG